MNPHERSRIDHQLCALKERVAELDAQSRKSFLKLKALIEGAVQALAAVTALNDPYTAEHQARVGWLAGAIAREMGLSEDQIEGVCLAGAVHDIGKIHIPGEILNKPAPLNEHEMTLVRHHSEAGHDVLKPLDWPWPLAKIVLQHHERLDGSGHPYRLEDGDILLEAKIIAVADVVEAMLSHRPYRPALGIDEALDEIDRGSGTRYHDGAVRACLQVFARNHFPTD